MTCIVPTCGNVAGSFRRFPRQAVLTERWLQSIQSGCGVNVNLLDPDEGQVCLWHFETPGISPSVYEDENQYLEPRKFLDCHGNQVETDSCRLCLEFFRSCDMLDMNGQVGGVQIKTMVFESLEIDLQGLDILSSICSACLARLEVLNSIKSDFLAAQTKFRYIIKTVQEPRIEEVEVILDLEHVTIKEENGAEQMLYNRPEMTVGNVEGRLDSESTFEEHVEKAVKVSDSDEWTPPLESALTVSNRKGRPRRTTAAVSSKPTPLRDIVERKCYICTTLFEDRFALAAHLAEKHAPESSSSRCEKCSREFFTLSSFNRHLARHDESERPFKCDHCSLGFITDETRQFHVKKVHSSKATMGTEPSVKGSSFVCEFCGKSYSTKSLLKQHIQTRHSNVRKTCTICEASFSCHGSLERHMMGHTGVKPYACDQCDATYRRALLLREHKHKAHGVKDPFVCKVCKQEFDKYFDLYRHNQVVHCNKPLPKWINKSQKAKPKTAVSRTRNFSNLSTCKLCNIQATSSDLRTHIEECHAGEMYPFHQCSECPRNFFTYAAWYTHKISHSDKFACKECGKGFGNAVSLQAHVDGTHGGGGRVECSECPGKLFKTSFSLYNHVVRLHRHPQQHECEFCQKRFNRKDNLDTHRRVHTGEKPFACDNCTMRFGDPSTAYKHRKRCGEKEASKA